MSGVTPIYFIIDEIFSTQWKFYVCEGEFLLCTGLIWVLLSCI